MGTWVVINAGWYHSAEADLETDSLLDAPMALGM
jgi:hypothetical protein